MQTQAHKFEIIFFLKSYILSLISKMHSHESQNK